MLIKKKRKLPWEGRQKLKLILILFYRTCPLPATWYSIIVYKSRFKIVFLLLSTSDKKANSVNLTFFYYSSALCEQNSVVIRVTVAIKKYLYHHIDACIITRYNIYRY